MPRARQRIVNVGHTPYYHVMSRCVRRAYLCGRDGKTGRSYEHRKKWLEQRIRLLSSVFAIDLCAYSIMSNHYHLVVKLVPQEANPWSEEEVLERWCCLFRGTLLVQQLRRGESLTPAEMQAVHETSKIYRKRLTSLSWFMKCLNEPIARRANAEDDCKGHFWESRFTSQAITSDRTLLASMVYVDLNPIRAGIASIPEMSEFTSAKERIHPSFNLRQAILNQFGTHGWDPDRLRAKPLAKFSDEVDASLKENATILPFKRDEYLELLDATGRLVRDDKRGYVESSFPPILQRLKFSYRTWERYSTQFEELHRRGEFRMAFSK